MSDLGSIRSLKQIQVNLLLFVLVAGEIYSSAGRLLPEDHGFSVSRDLKLKLAVDRNRQPKLHSEVAGSNSAPLPVMDIAHPGGLSAISAEISFEGKTIRGRPHSPSSSGHNNNNNNFDQNGKEFVFNLFPKGPVTPSGPSHRGNEMVTERRLSSMQEGSKRFLGSVPSPGVGH